MKKLFLFTLVMGAFVVGCTSCVSSLPAQRRFIDSEANVDGYFRATVALISTPHQGTPPSASCTAFFIGPRILATANHCVAPDFRIRLIVPGVQEEEETGHETVYFMTFEEFEAWNADFGVMHPSHTAQVIATNVVHDIAILRLADEEESSTEWLRIATHNPEVGSRLYSVGMPIGLPWVLSDGVLSRIMNEAPGKERILHTVAVQRGSSGSSLIDDTGRVVGVNVQIFYSMDSLGLSIPSHYILELLEAEGILLNPRTATMNVNAPAHPTRSQCGSSSCRVVR